MLKFEIIEKGTQLIGMNFIAVIICPNGGNLLAGVLNVSAFGAIFEIKYMLCIRI
jgi:hypothetical protein